MKLLNIILCQILCLFTMSILCSCNNDEPEQPIPPVKFPERTVLVYMVAACDLGQGRADINDIAEMRTAAMAGKLGNNRWIIYHSTTSGSNLLELTAEGDTVVLKNYPKGYSVKIARMSEVIDDTKALAPANSYGMVFWSHGTGWIEDGIDDESTIHPQSFGSDFGETMNITSLRQALHDKDLDYLYFDCCLMGSIEVVYELRDCARYIVSSPSELPWNGMPYNENLEYLVDGSREALVNAATNTFNHYNNLTSAYDRSCTMSVIDTEKIEALAVATAAIYDVTPLEHPLNVVTNYYGRDTSRQAKYLDFGEYINALCNYNNVDNELATVFNNALADVVIFEDSTEKLWNNWPMYSTCGLSTRVFNHPDNINLDGYNRLQWTIDVVSHHIH